uniref:Protein kinase domain-containing protein n=1 Tax=Vitis vinifera TaxID=29760 RepID=F6GXC4_VITVI
MGKCITSQKIIAVVDVGLLSIEEKEARGEVMVTGASFKSGATHTRSKSTLWEYSSVCSRLTWLASAANQFAGQVPTSLGLLEHLGSIPKRIMSLKYLNWLDLGDYNLNGAIPSTITRMKNLRRLYLAGNQLEQTIPNEICLLRKLGEMDLGNNKLSGTIPSCKGNLTHLQSMLLSCNSLSSAIPSRSCHATNDFSEANILGVGSFGSVFKGILSEGTLVAVKVLNLQLEGAFKSFDAECKVLARVRHRNLVKVISSCSNPELRALVLQYMPNGSLEKWLYSFNYCFSLFQRVSIMEDVALALEYLHHGQAEPVVQCDLKPSNVLLDDEMVAHVGDFGIAKILTQKKTETQTKTLGTLGYIAPEYSSEGRVSTRGDTYSYGIMLMEMLTGKNTLMICFSEN